ncbi:glutamine amidotransferase [Corynebacterium cystitidis]|uniref:GMP synthase (Glutamine-hydrolysing) n=1 Tax=Corynebacterium cystitidis DSM 20524 TaxID=1121357 RepID=A0A1H9PL40_9CORY|nr:glutamine amidotransferase [Corynebacterium cystitidis]WJY82455.1 GMP synthase [glutamine-hydrolyzing] [Corynebacterium cystitidis DSM 20524]SER48914.1 GMP synthase (glutamine-hydrolysing) [Corynebacterium cystitidis DSM 20524]SNV75494.1 glutamine amidotransferase [Corynebacterium cystitidis]
MSKILLLSLRDGPLGNSVAAAEARDVMNATGLTSHTMVHRILESTQHVIGSLEGISGVIVGGSSLNITDAEWSKWQHHVHAQLAELIDGSLPVFLICYGTSWLTHHTGGSVNHAHAEESGPTVVKLTKAGRDDALLNGFPEEFSSLTGHTENAESPSEVLEVLATGPTCPVQLVRYRDRVWASQFHAEMDAQAMKTRMDFYFDYGYFSPDDYDQIVAGLPSVDTTWANRILRRFVEACFTGQY